MSCDRIKFLSVWSNLICISLSISMDILLLFSFFIINSVDNIETALKIWSINHTKFFAKILKNYPKTHHCINDASISPFPHRPPKATWFQNSHIFKQTLHKIFTESQFWGISLNIRVEIHPATGGKRLNSLSNFPTDSLLMNEDEFGGNQSACPFSAKRELFIQECEPSMNKLASHLSNHLSRVHWYLLNRLHHLLSVQLGKGLFVTLKDLSFK